MRAASGIAGFGGLRQGEITGLWREDDRQDVLAISRSMWRSTLKVTKTGEDDEDPGLVPVILPLRSLLDAINKENAAGFFLPNSLGGALDLDNLADRVIKPALEANGLEWKGWHAYRRGLATNLKDLGVDDKAIQRILRHQDVSTTQRFYIKTASRAARNPRKPAAKIACSPVVPTWQAAVP